MKKLNFHFTSACNMKCRYCFVPQNKNLGLKELMAVMDKIGESKIFGQINFVGGEPTTSRHLLPLLKKAKDLGLRTSIVTNGYILSKMDPRNFNEMASLLDTIGLSIDSLDEGTNRLIGRTVGKNVLTQKDYLDLCRRIKESGCRLKINTVVSRLNCSEDFSGFYETICPDRIKIFQVLKPNVATKTTYDNLLISRAMFNDFIKGHSRYKIVTENNSDMTSAYYMLGSDGCFWDNASGRKSRPVLSVSVEDALSEIYVDEEKYQRRYA